MNNEETAKSFSSLSTPLVADACLRLKVALRFAPPELKPLIQGTRVAGKAIPAMHFGSVDVFLEAMGEAEKGDVIVIDNGARREEACIGDLTVLEAQASGLSGMVVNGYHRDTEELRRIGFPVFSLGSIPAGPRRLDKRTPDAMVRAGFGTFSVEGSDFVFGDDDGVVFVSSTDVGAVLDVAQKIFKVERRQADSVRAGNKLRDQLRLKEYVEKRATDPAYTFRMHLRETGGAVEE